MFEFYLWETVAIPITIEPAGTLEDVKDIIVSLYQTTKGAKIDKPMSDLIIEGDTITINLSQEETGSFTVGEIQIQVNIYYNDTERDTSGTATLRALKNLYAQVMS